MFEIADKVASLQYKKFEQYFDMVANTKDTSLLSRFVSITVHARAH